MMPPRTAYWPRRATCGNVLVASLAELLEQLVAVELRAALESQFQPPEDIGRGHGLIEAGAGEDQELAAFRGAQFVDDGEPLGRRSRDRGSRLPRARHRPSGKKSASGNQLSSFVMQQFLLADIRGRTIQARRLIWCASTAARGKAGPAGVTCSNRPASARARTVELGRTSPRRFDPADRGFIKKGAHPSRRTAPAASGTCLPRTQEDAPRAGWLRTPPE